MRSFGKTDKGIQRAKNEDTIFRSDTSVGLLPNLYIIADGMGGHKSGAFASDYAVNSFVKFVKNINDSNPVSIIKKGIKDINYLLHEKSSTDDIYYRMGTTFVVATIIDDKLYIGNIGDSRLYIINKAIHKITKDHSLVEELIHTGYITEDEAQEHPEKHVITRAVGIEPYIEVDIYQINLNKEDNILMCSDGLTNMLKEEEIQKMLKETTDIKKTVELLIDKANQNGGNDNISVIIINQNDSEVKTCYNLE